MGRLESEDIEIKNNQSDIEAMEKEKDDLDTENVDLKNKVNTLMASQNNLLPEPGGENMKHKIQELERQTTRSEVKLEENDERLTNVLTQKDDLSNQLIGMEKERDDLDKENSVLQAELNQKKNEIKLLKARLDFLQSTNNINVS